MREINFKTEGICAHGVKVTIDDNNIIQNVTFNGGCDGNHKGLNALCKGRNASEIADLLSGIKCGYKESSCPDQLSKALKSNGF